MPFTLTLISNNIEDNMTIKINPNDTLKIEGSNICIHNKDTIPIVVAKYNSTDRLWHGYDKTFKEIVFK